MCLEVIWFPLSKHLGETFLEQEEERKQLFAMLSRKVSYASLNHMEEVWQCMEIKGQRKVKEQPKKLYLGNSPKIPGLKGLHIVHRLWALPRHVGWDQLQGIVTMVPCPLIWQWGRGRCSVCISSSLNNQMIEISLVGRVTTFSH